MSFPSRFFGELQRRSVVKVAAGYVVSGWLLIQVASIVIPAFGWPDWVMRITLIALVAGFPVACVLAWAFEWTTAGILREDEETDVSETPSAGESAGGSAGEAADDARLLERLVSWEGATIGLVMIVALGIGLVSLPSVDAARPQHIAVLPFRVVSAQAAEAGLLAAGLTETLTSSITRFGQFDNTLWVVPAAEITDAMTPSTAHQRFGASLVVSGSMQVAQNRVRLTLNLIDTHTGRQIDSRQIDVAKSQMIDLQDQATQHLARMLDLRIPARKALPHNDDHANDPDLGRLYVEGRGLLRSATSVADIDGAIDRFLQALAIDSSFALASAGLGEAYWQKYERTRDVQWVSAAIQRSQRALAIDSTLAPVWTTLGILRSEQRHDEAAIQAFERAIDIEPGASDPYRHLATVYRRMGQMDRAEVTYREAIARQPEYWKNYNLLGTFYYRQGRYDDAVVQYVRGLRLAPGNPSLLNNLAVAYWQMREIDRATTAFEKLVALDSTHASAVPNLATAYFYVGRFDEAAELYQQALDRYPKDYGLAGSLADAQTWSSAYADRAPDTYRHAITLAEEHLSVRERDPWVLASLAQYHLRLSERAPAQVWMKRLEATVDRETIDAVMAFTLGALHEKMGHRDEAWQWIQIALERNYGWIQLSYSPFLADLRQDERVARRLQQDHTDPTPQPEP